jgi:hypothetical protein
VRPQRLSLVGWLCIVAMVIIALLGPYHDGPATALEVRYAAVYAALLAAAIICLALAAASEVQRGE